MSNAEPDRFPSDLSTPEFLNRYLGELVEIYAAGLGLFEGVYYEIGSPVDSAARALIPAFGLRIELRREERAVETAADPPGLLLSSSYPDRADLLARACDPLCKVVHSIPPPTFGPGDQEGPMRQKHEGDSGRGPPSLGQEVEEVAALHAYAAHGGSATEATTLGIQRGACRALGQFRVDRATLDVLCALSRVRSDSHMRASEHSCER